LPDSNTTIKELLEAGAHFGHQTSYWHPRMKTYIFTKRDGIHIINLEQTAGMLDKACVVVKDIVASGGTILFVGTKNRPTTPSKRKPNAAGCTGLTSAGSEAH